MFNLSKILAERASCLSEDLVLLWKGQLHTNWADSYVVNLSSGEKQPQKNLLSSNCCFFFLNITGCGSFLGHNSPSLKVKILPNWQNKMTTLSFQDWNSYKCFQKRLYSNWPQNSLIWIMGLHFHLYFGGFLIEI